MNLSVSGILAGVIFGSIGFVAFIYGKKMSDWKIMIVSIALMAYPYFIQNTLAQYGLGILLTASLFFFHD